jgi:hypothetical protein
MTKMLELAFTEAGKLTSTEQDLLASRLLAGLADEDDFDRAIAASADKLAALANEALAEHRAGQTQELPEFSTARQSHGSGSERTPITINS